MAATLGVVASGMAVVSLAIQMAESFQTLKKFFSLVKSAPDDLLFTLKEVELTSIILEDIDRSVQQQLSLDGRVKLSVMKSYRLCQRSRDSLQELIASLQITSTKGKKWGNIRTALNKDKIEEMLKCLERVRSMMMLAGQIYYQAEQRQERDSLYQELFEMRISNEQRHHILEDRMLEVQSLLAQTSNFSQVMLSSESGVRGPSCTIEDEAKNNTPDQEEESGTPTKCKRRDNRLSISKEKSFLAGIVTIVALNGPCTAMASLHIRLSSWILGRQYQVNLLRSYQGWDLGLRSSRVIHKSSIIFDFAKAGNVDGIRRIFDLGQATPFDVDLAGFTALHYAALFARPAVCRFLLEKGADPNARTALTYDYSQMWKGFWNVSTDIIYSSVLDYPAYSTPLHLVSMITTIFRQHGRSLLLNRQVSERPIDDDLHDTIQILVGGGSDALYETRRGCSAFDMFGGSRRTLRWLRQQEQLELEGLRAESLLELIRDQQHSTLALKTKDKTHEYVLELLPDLRITKELALVETHRWHMENSNFSLLLEILVRGWADALIKDQGCLGDDRRGWEQLISDSIRQSIDVHAYMECTCLGRYTALYYLIHQIPWARRVWPAESLSWKALTKRVLKSWFDVLFRCGCDLVEYMRVEKTIKERLGASDDLWNEDHLGWGTILSIRECTYLPESEVLEIKIGETPETLQVVSEDPWASFPLAADFWSWVEEDFGGCRFDWLNRELEHPSELESSEGEIMPGSWPEGEYGSGTELEASEGVDE